jgi:hypothetical protein
MDAPVAMDAPVMTMTLIEEAAKSAQASQTQARAQGAPAAAPHTLLFSPLVSSPAPAKSPAPVVWPGLADDAAVASSTNASPSPGKRPPSEAPSSTPGKRDLPRYTPTKLLKSEKESDVHSARKVRFAEQPAQPNFEDLEYDEGEAEDVFPTFSLPNASKENVPTAGSTDRNVGASTLGSRGTKAAAVGELTASVLSASLSATVGTRTSLGGALRVPARARQPSDRNTIGGVAPKTRNSIGFGGRRMSLAAQQAVEGAERRMSRR